MLAKSTLHIEPLESVKCLEKSLRYLLLLFDFFSIILILLLSYCCLVFNALYYNNDFYVFRDFKQKSVKIFYDVVIIFYVIYMYYR